MKAPESRETEALSLPGEGLRDQTDLYIIHITYREIDAEELTKLKDYAEGLGYPAGATIFSGSNRDVLACVPITPEIFGYKNFFALYSKFSCYPFLSSLFFSLYQNNRELFCSMLARALEES
jgi:hypothetical protein